MSYLKIYNQRINKTILYIIDEIISSIIEMIKYNANKKVPCSYTEWYYIDNGECYIRRFMKNFIDIDKTKIKNTPNCIKVKYKKL